MSNELKIAIEAARAGAAKAMQYFSKNPEVIIKPDKTPVTIADRKCEQTILQILSKNFPQSTFLAEESSHKIQNNDFVWIVDPIDATKNFIRNLPFWGIQIALAKKGQVVLGISYAPVLDELFVAEKAQGTFLNGKKVFVSMIDSLKNATLLHGTIDFFGEKTNNLLKLSRECNYERGFGDFYGYTLVASGKADIMTDARNGGPWDIAAVSIIVKEAGGQITNINGNPWSLSDRNAVATNGLLHDQVIDLLNK